MAKKSLTEQLEEIAATPAAKEPARRQVIPMLGVTETHDGNHVVVEVHYDVLNNENVFNTVHNCGGREDAYNRFKILAIDLGIID